MNKDQIKKLKSLYAELNFSQGEDREKVKIAIIAYVEGILSNTND